MRYIRFTLDPSDDISVVVPGGEDTADGALSTEAPPPDPAEASEIPAEETSAEVSEESPPEIEGMPFENAVSYLWIIALVLFGAVCLNAIHRAFRSLREGF